MKMKKFGMILTLSATVCGGVSATEEVLKLSSEDDFPKPTKMIKKGGEFVFESPPRVIMSTKTFEVDQEKTYILEGSFRNLSDNDIHVYFGFAPFDSNDKRILPHHVNCAKETESELTKELKVGDTTIHLKDVAGLANLKKDTSWGKAGKHWFVAFNTKDNFSDLPNRNLSPKINSISDNEVTLIKPVKKAYPAGTKIRIQYSGDTYIYTAAVKRKTNNQWQKFYGQIKGKEWRPGATKARVVIYPYTSKNNREAKIQFKDISIKIVSSKKETTQLSKWSLKKINGVTTLFHNDEPMLLNMVYSEDTKNKKWTTSLSQVFSKEAAVKAYQLPTNVDWTPHDISNSINGKDLIQRLSLLLDSSPDSYVIIRILLWPPSEWAEKYPEEMVWNEEGIISSKQVAGRAPFSVLSEFYTDKATEAVARIVKAVEESQYASRVIGYMPCIGWSGESNAYRADDSIADHSPAAKKSFKKYLFKKYKSIENINAALGSNFKDIKEISVPPEEKFLKKNKTCFVTPEKNRFAREYYVFSEETLADNILKICRAVKKINPNKLTGTFYGQIVVPGYIRSHLTYGRYCLKKLGTSSDLDFIYALGFYGHSGIEHPLRLQSLVDSMNPYGKAVMVGYDRPTHLLCYLPVVVNHYVQGDGIIPSKITWKEHEERKKYYKKSRGEDYGKNFRTFLVEKEKEGPSAYNYVPTTDRCPADMQETINNIKRYTSFCVTKPTIGILWWDQEGTRRNPIGGLAFNHPRLMQEIKKTGEIFAQANSMNRKSRAEVAVFYDNISLFYRTPTKGRDYINDAFVSTSLALSEAGIPFDEYFFDQIEKITNIKQYKMLIFLNTNYVSKERRKWISENLKRDNKTLIWFFASGLINEDGIKTKNIENLTGIKVKEELTPEIMACSITRFSRTPTPLGGIPEKYQAFGNLVLAKRYTPWYSINDPASVVMGKSIINHKAVFAIKEFLGWRSIVMPTGPIPVPILRKFAKLNKIHIYTENKNVIVWAVKDLLAIHTYRDQKGELTINLPPDVKGCTDMYSGERYLVESGRIKLNVNGFTIKLIHLER